MNVSKLIETINVNNHDCSLLLVDPKPNMLEWLSSFYKGKMHEKYRLYYPEANHVVIIPKVERFYERPQEGTKALSSQARGFRLSHNSRDVRCIFYGLDKRSSPFNIRF